MLIASVTLFLCVRSLVAASRIPRASLLPQTPTEAQDFPALINATLDDLTDGLERGLFNSQTLVKTYLERIGQVNDKLHCVTEISPDALSIAASLDEMRMQGKILGPLHGIPILLKNNIATNDQMNNTAGSYALLGAKVPRDSTVAAKLRQAGAIILGKANLSQWANARSTNSTNGWSAYGGQTFGAYHIDQDPRGSSSGSAVATALGLSFAAFGTETSGSIMSPSQRGNVVGIKPTVGLTSRYLVIPVTQHQDTVGPIARTVKDAAYLLEAIAGPDSRDNYTAAIPNNGHVPKYTSACQRGALHGARIGVARNVLESPMAYLDATVLTAFDEAVAQIQAAGATIVEANFTAYEQWLNDNNETLVGNADILTDMAGYLAELTYNPFNLTNLAEINGFTHGVAAEDWPYKDTGGWDGPGGAIPQGWNNSDPRFWPAYQRDLFYGGEGGVLGALRRTNTTAILLPTLISQYIPALVGSPIVTVPMGFYPQNSPVVREPHGLIETGPNVPIGLAFLGARFGEMDLISYAYDYEQMTHHRDRVQPFLQATAELPTTKG